MSEWRLLYMPPQEGEGHKLFMNDKGLSICDWSGDNPDEADDGPLYIRRDAPVTMSLRNNKLVFMVRLVGDCHADINLDSYLAMRNFLPLDIEIESKLRKTVNTVLVLAKADISVSL